MTDRRVSMCNRTRPWTPDTVHADGATTVHVKRACNGCGALLGDVTDAEMDHAMAGLPTPDVRNECPYCTRTKGEVKR